MRVLESPTLDRSSLAGVESNTCCWDAAQETCFFEILKIESCGQVALEDADKIYNRHSFKKILDICFDVQRFILLKLCVPKVQDPVPSTVIDGDTVENRVTNVQHRNVKGGRSP